MALPGWDSITGASTWSKGFAIAGFVALFFVVLFDVLAFVYSERKDVLIVAEERRRSEEQQRKQQEVDREHEEAEERRKSEIAQANSKAADAQAQAEQLRQQAAPRNLSPIERQKISAYLAGKPVGTFVISATIAASDARNYAEQIADMFRTAGWTVTINNAVFAGPNITGLWITVKDRNAPPQAAGLLQHAFAAAGINVRGEYDPGISDPNATFLAIGAKQ